MKHKAIYIFLFCVTISFTVLCCIQYVKQKDLRLINEELRKEVTKNNFLHALIEGESYGTKSVGKILPNDIKLISQTGDTVMLKDIICDTNLIFNFSGSQCKLCAEEQIKMMKNELKVLMNYVFVFSDYVSSREMKVFKQTYNLESPVYTLTNPIGLPVDSIGRPYFFSIEKTDNKMYVKNVFVPLKELPALSKNFLGSFNDRYTY